MFKLISRCSFENKTVPKITTVLWYDFTSWTHWHLENVEVGSFDELISWSYANAHILIDKKSTFV